MTSARARRRCAGFTLQEVLIAVASLGGVTAVATAVATSLHQEERHFASFERDLRSLQRAIDLLDADVRAGAYEDADWSLLDGRLRRGAQTVARGVTLLEVVPDGEVVRVRLRVRPGNDAPGGRGPVHAEWTVRPRAEAAR